MKMELERVKKEIAKRLKQQGFFQRLNYARISDDEIAEYILSIDGILIKSDDQRLLDSPFAKAADKGDMHAQSKTSGYYCSQNDMLKPDSEGSVWVKVEPKRK